MCNQSSVFGVSWHPECLELHPGALQALLKPLLAGLVAGEAPAQRAGVQDLPFARLWQPLVSLETRAWTGRAKLQHQCLLSKLKMGCQTFWSLGSLGCVWGLFIRSKLEVGYSGKKAACQAATTPAWSSASFPEFPSLIWFVSTFIRGVFCQTPQLCQESCTAALWLGLDMDLETAQPRPARFAHLLDVLWGGGCGWYEERGEIIMELPGLMEN